MWPRKTSNPHKNLPIFCIFSTNQSTVLQLQSTVKGEDLPRMAVSALTKSADWWHKTTCKVKTKLKLIMPPPHSAVSHLSSLPPSLSPRAEVQCHSHGCVPLPACTGLTDPMWQQHRTRERCASLFSSSCLASLLAVKHIYIYICKDRYTHTHTQGM